MADSPNLLKTPLHDWHVRNHATMAEFGGYHMPLWYETGAKYEHCNVIRSAGLFDTSHMAAITVEGPGSFELLQHCFTRDLARCIGTEPGPLQEGRSVYGLFLLEDGSVLDDAIVSLLAEDRYLVVVNSGMGAKISDHLDQVAVAGMTVTDYTDQIGKIDLQGPAAALILDSLLDDPDSVLRGMVYFSFKGDIFSAGRQGVHLKDGTPVLVSRTGYTGEFGFELYVKARDTVSLWQQLLEAGAGRSIAACGLASRDSLRTGAMLPLSHQDIGNWTFGRSPWSFVLPWDETGGRFSKQFVGAEAVSARDGSGYTYGFAGYDPRKIPIGPETAVFGEADEQIGTVLTCTTDMAIGRVEERIISLATPETTGRPADFQARGLSCGFILTTRECRSGEKVRLSAGKRSVTVEIRDDIRPDRTARRPMEQMRRKN